MVNGGGEGVGVSVGFFAFTEGFFLLHIGDHLTSKRLSLKSLIPFQSTTSP